MPKRRSYEQASLGPFELECVLERRLLAILGLPGAGFARADLGPERLNPRPHPERLKVSSSFRLNRCLFLNKFHMNCLFYMA
jgi:hypothetical protein